MWFVITVSTGTVTVNPDNSVQVITEGAYPLDQFDISVSYHIRKMVI